MKGFALFFLVLWAAPIFGEGPVFQHKDPVVQQEFENVYKDVRGVSVSSGAYISNQSTIQSGATFFVSSGTANAFTATTVSASTVTGTTALLFPAGTVSAGGLGWSGADRTGFYVSGSYPSESLSMKVRGLSQFSSNSAGVFLSVDFASQRSNGGGTVLSTVENQSNTASSSALLDTIVAGTSAGNAFGKFRVSGGATWALGLDNADSQSFKISGGSALGTNDALRISSATFGVAIRGTNTNDAATAGYVGETALSSTVRANFPATATWGDLTSKSLTAGDWLCMAPAASEFIATTISRVQFGLSTTSGNSSTGLVEGYSQADTPIPTGNIDAAVTIGPVHFSLNATTTVYLKYKSTYSGTAPVGDGTIVCWRIR